MCLIPIQEMSLHGFYHPCLVYTPRRGVLKKNIKDNTKPKAGTVCLYIELHV